MKRIAPFLTICASCLVWAACGGPPANYVLLEEARSAYQQAQNDSAVVANASTDLAAAEEALNKSQALWQENADETQINHYAYLARQYVRIAEEKANLKTAENAIGQAELERTEVQLQARTMEAEQAERQAEANQRAAKHAQQEAALEKQEAERAQQVAQAAIARARELAERVQELEARETERGLVLTLGDVLFDVDEATLKPGGLRAVDQLALFLAEYPERKVLIEGHTDNTGTDEYNHDLSQRRADAVRRALLERNISETRIGIRGYGEMYPIAGNDTAVGRQQNRRVEVIISDEQGQIPQPLTMR